MVEKINSEFLISKTVGKETINLIVYINYKSKTYDIVQECEEGIFPRKNCQNTIVNKAFFELGIEALELIERMLEKRTTTT